MPKRIPITAARTFAEKFGLRQVCIIGWEADEKSQTQLTHVVTYGKSITDCEQAAILGNKVKKQVLRWPEEHCNSEPARVRRRKKKEGVFFLNEKHTTHTTKGQARKERAEAKKRKTDDHHRCSVCKGELSITHIEGQRVVGNDGHGQALWRPCQRKEN